MKHATLGITMKERLDSANNSRQDGPNHRYITCDKILERAIHSELL